MLVENSGKTQLMAMGKERREELENLAEQKGVKKEAVKDFMEVLGCEMVQNKSRKMTPKEVKNWGQQRK